MADLIGQRLGQYEIIGLLGEGGMAGVYRARQQTMKRDVAVKVIKTGLIQIGDFVKRFAREAETVAALSHPHILKVFDYGQHEDTVYLVMELLTGGSLADLIRRGPLSTDIVSRIFDQIGPALDYAHELGIIHRDLKPQNVLMDGKGNAILTDFGIAKITHATTGLTQSGVAMGTPAYMSPEQWKGKTLDARSDVYALGVMLFEMLSRTLPFQGDTPASMMYMHLQEPPPSIVRYRLDVNPAVDKVIAKALAKAPDQRFMSASELATVFKAALSGKKMSSAPAKPVKPIVASTISTPIRTARSVLIPIGAAIAVLLLIGVVVVALSGHNAASPPPTTTNPVTQIAAIIIPTATPTVTFTSQPTGTNTALPPTSTPIPHTLTSTVVPPTSTPIPPTAAPTRTPNLELTISQNVANALTGTALVVASSTKTPLPSATFTATPVPSTLTSTPVPNATFTLTPTAIPPTLTDTPAPTNTPIMAIATVKTSPVNLRSGPGTAYSIVGTASQGNQLPVIAKSDNGQGTWYLITQPNGQSAWISARFVNLSINEAVIVVAATVPAVSTTYQAGPVSNPANQTPENNSPECSPNFDYQPWQGLTCWVNFVNNSGVSVQVLSPREKPTVPPGGSHSFLAYLGMVLYVYDNGSGTLLKAIPITKLGITVSYP